MAPKRDLLPVCRGIRRLRVRAHRVIVFACRTRLHSDFQQRSVLQVDTVRADNPRHDIGFGEPHQNGEEIGHALVEPLDIEAEAVPVGRTQSEHDRVADLASDDVVGQGREDPLTLQIAALRVGVIGGEIAERHRERFELKVGVASFETVRQQAKSLNEELTREMDRLGLPLPIDKTGS